MTKFMQYATAMTTASLLSLGAAMAQETDAEAEAQANVETETSIELDETSLSTYAEERFNAADANEDGTLNEEEYRLYTESVAQTMKDDYAVYLDTDTEITGTRKVDVTSSGAINDLLKQDGSSRFENAEQRDKIAEASSARYAELNTGTGVEASAVTGQSRDAFLAADANGDELITEDELEVYASTLTGLNADPEAKAEAEARAQAEAEAEAAAEEAEAEAEIQG